MLIIDDLQQSFGVNNGGKKTIYMLARGRERKQGIWLRKKYKELIEKLLK